MRTGTKRFGALVCALGLSFGVAACGGSDSTDGGGSGNAAEAECPLPALTESGEGASGEKVKISLWYGGLAGKSKTVMTEIVDAYNDSQDRVEVTASDQGSAYTQVLSKYTAAIPDRIPNIVYADSATTQFLVDSGTIIPGGVCADEGVVPMDDIVPVVKAFFTLDGAYVPGAVNVSTPQFYYNKKSFEDAGMPTEPPPGTLDEVRAKGEELLEADLPEMQWPLSITVNPWYLETLLTGIGQDMVDNDNGHAGHATEAIFDTPEALAVLEQLADMYDDGLIAKVSNTPGQYDHYLNLAQGKSAMLFETSTAATTIEAFLGGELTAEELANNDLSALGSVTVVPGFGPMPGVEEPGQVMVSGGAQFVTNAGSELEQAAAMDFIRFVNEVPQQAKWHIEGSYLPSNANVTEDPAVQTFYAESIAGLSLKMAADQLAGVSPENPGPMYGPEDEVTEILQSMLEGVFLSGDDPAEALTQAEADVTAAIQEYNETNGF